MWRTCRFYLPQLQQKVLQVPYGTSVFGAGQRFKVTIYVSGLLEEKAGCSQSEYGECKDL
jgi:hypothetical protein